MDKEEQQESLQQQQEEEQETPENKILSDEIDSGKVNPESEEDFKATNNNLDESQVIESKYQITKYEEQNRDLLFNKLIQIQHKYLHPKKENQQDFDIEKLILSIKAEKNKQQLIIKESIQKLQQNLLDKTQSFYENQIKDLEYMKIGLKFVGKQHSEHKQRLENFKVNLKNHERELQFFEILNNDPFKFEQSLDILNGFSSEIKENYEKIYNFYNCAPLLVNTVLETQNKFIKDSIEKIQNDIYQQLDKDTHLKSFKEQLSNLNEKYSMIQAPQIGFQQDEGLVYLQNGIQDLDGGFRQVSTQHEQFEHSECFNPTNIATTASFYDNVEGVLYTGGWDGSIEIFKQDSSIKFHKQIHERPVKKMIKISSGYLASISEDGFMVLIDEKSFEIFKKIKISEQKLYAISETDYSNYLNKNLSFILIGGEDGNLYILDQVEFEVINTVQVGIGITVMKFVDNLLIIGDNMGYLKMAVLEDLIHSSIEFELVQEVHDDWITALDVLQINSHEYQILSGSYDTLVKEHILRREESGQFSFEMQRIYPSQDTVQDIKILNDRQFLSVCENIVSFQEEGKESQNKQFQDYDNLLSIQFFNNQNENGGVSVVLTGSQEKPLIDILNLK